MTPVIVAYSVAGVGLATFAIAGALALAKDAQLEDDCSPNCTNAEVNLLSTEALVADIGLGVGLVAGAVGTILLFNRQSSEPAQASIAVSPWVARGAAGAYARGAF